MPRDSDLETSVERADKLVGTIFDRRFRIEERIATGGFGAIYRATHVKSGHPVALKVLLPSLAQDLGVVARFRREGATLTALRNPHTITAYELGQAADRTLFITMELLHGESLFERYKAQGPFEWKRMVRIARQICESLEEAHAMGIVHRDLKPTNIHLETKGGDIDFVKVLDFGIAKIIGGELEAADLTNAGQMVGTLDYMSPEQMVGGTITGQTDIYTLGIVMYEMIAGATPFPEAMTAAQALAAVMKLEPDPLYLRAPVPEELDRIVRKCLARETERRYQTVTELRADLDRLLAGGVADRAAGLETKPVPRHDDEATMFTPPPEPLVAATRRAKRPSGEETTFTPPPEPLLAASRRAADWSNEATTAGTPSAQLLAASRRAKRPSVEETSFTPPPAQVLAELRTAPRPRQDPGHEWTDDDEHAATVRRRRESSDTERQSGEHDKVTAVARLADIVERAAKARGQAHARRDASERAVTVPRGDASERAVTVPRGARDDDSPVEPATPPYPRQRGGLPSRDANTVPARVPPPAARKPPSAPPRAPDEVAPGARKPPSAPPRALSSDQSSPPGMSPSPAIPRAVAPHEPAAPMLPRSVTPHEQAAPMLPPTATPHQLAAPMLPRTVTPHEQAAPMLPRTVTPHQLAAPALPPHPSAAPGLPPPLGAPMPSIAVAPYSSSPPHAPSPYPTSYPSVSGAQHAAGFDMGKLAAREATIRRVIWIVVLVVAVGVGVVLAAQLG